MIPFIIYDSEGRIKQTGVCQKELLEEQVSLVPTYFGLQITEGNADLFTDYVSSESVLKKPTQATLLDKATLTANGIDVINITGAPYGIFTATNVVTGESVSGLINGSDTFETTVVGTYAIKIEAFPYLDFTTTIEAI